MNGPDERERVASEGSSDFVDAAEIPIRNAVIA
jgi:hypothetical protein